MDAVRVEKIATGCVIDDLRVQNGVHTTSSTPNQQQKASVQVKSYANKVRESNSGLDQGTLQKMSILGGC